MSSTADLIRGAVQTAAAGKPVDSNSLSSVDSSNETPEGQLSSDDVAESRDSTVEDGFQLAEQEGEDTPKDSTDSTETPEAPEKVEAKQPTSEKEVITVTDADGKKRKVEIDYSDRGAIRKAHELAAGARKWQAERDRDRQAAKQIQEKLSEIEGRFKVLDDAWTKQGIEGVVDLLSGRTGAYKEAAKKQYERERFLAEATPAEIKELERQEALERERAEKEQLRKENEEFKATVQQEREAAERRAMESKIHPVFDKYRFKDKLGDESDEHIFDQMLWKTAMDNLEPYEAEGLDITPELIEREFKAVASTIRKRMNTQAVKTAAKVVEQKKQEATEHVQAKVKSGYKSGGVAKEAQDLLDNGNLSALLKGWGKYSKVFNR